MTSRITGRHTFRSRRAWLTSLAAVSLAGGLLFATIPGASANEPLPESASLQELVQKSVPEWNFPRANNNDPCWPEDAFDSSGNPTDGADLQNWPNSDGGCPAVNTPFPTYFTAQNCNDNEVRISFTIYQATSGFQPSGHRHDFEHVVVIWKKDNGSWVRDQLLLSGHGKHSGEAWADVESKAADRSTAGNGLEFPRVYVGFGSHAMFNNQGGLKDVLSAYTGLEYRQADYPSYADQGGGLVEVTKGGDLFNKFEANAAHYGSADSNPAFVANGACSF
jgi:hypothetical protein